MWHDIGAVWPTLPSIKLVRCVLLSSPDVRVGGLGQPLHRATLPDTTSCSLTRTDTDTRTRTLTLTTTSAHRAISFFRDIQIAFQVLKDEGYRYLYNRFGLPAVQRHQIAWYVTAYFDCAHKRTIIHLDNFSELCAILFV
jgi:hypothetical protein